MIKKVLIILLATTITLTSTVTAFAVDTTPEANIVNNQKYAATEKADKNTLYHYKQQSEQFSQAYIDYLNKQAKSITDGISDDYGKAKAISSWVSENLWYNGDLYRDGKSIGSVNYFNPEDTGYRGADGIEIIAGDKGLCEDYAAFTVSLMRAVGIPAKEVWGYRGSQSHAWVEAYVDGKWLFTDPTYNSRNNVYKGEWSKQKASDNHYFDLPYETWSLAYHIDTDSTVLVNSEKNIFNGKLLFYSTDHGLIQGLIKEVPTNLSAGDKLDSTYGFKSKDLYKDCACTQPWNMDEDIVDESHYVIYVKDYKPYHYTLYFDSQGGTVVDPITVPSRFTNVWIPMPEQFEPPKPTREGYDFVGWYPANYEYYAGAKVVDFKTEQVSDGSKFYAIWKDKATGTIAPTTGITTVAPTTTTAEPVTTPTNTATTPTTTTAPLKITGWYKANGHWTYYASKGLMKSSWLNDNGTWYYLDDSGIMKTGWLNYCRAWYYLNADGTLKTGWLKDNGKWYYLRANANGAMAHDTVTPDGYTVGSDGALIN